VWSVMGHDDGRSWEEREWDLDAQSDAELRELDGTVGSS
jgi:hypothetical protein